MGAQADEETISQTLGTFQVRGCAKAERQGCNSSWNFSHQSMAGWSGRYLA